MIKQNKTKMEAGMNKTIKYISESTMHKNTTAQDSVKPEYTIRKTLKTRISEALKKYNKQN